MLTINVFANSRDWSSLTRYILCGHIRLEDQRKHLGRSCRFSSFSRNGRWFHFLGDFVYKYLRWTKLTNLPLHIAEMTSIVKNIPDIFNMLFQNFFLVLVIRIRLYSYFCIISYALQFGKRTINTCQMSISLFFVSILAKNGMKLIGNPGV